MYFIQISPSVPELDTNLEIANVAILPKPLELQKGGIIPAKKKSLISHTKEMYLLLSYKNNFNKFSFISQS